VYVPTTTAPTETATLTCFALCLLLATGCLGSCLCPCCAQIVIRRKALNYDMSNYTCCQGYMDGIVPCARSGRCGESSCPNGCLCLEVRRCSAVDEVDWSTD
jgi:hypothetical protein